MVTRTDASSCERVGELGRSRVEFRVRTPARRAHDRLPVRNRGSDALEQVGEVVAHGPMVGVGVVGVNGPKTLMYPTFRGPARTDESLYALARTAARKCIDPIVSHRERGALA